MTSTELRDSFVEALRRLGPKSEYVEAFRSALSLRQREGDPFESDEPSGLRSALAGALSIYAGREGTPVTLARQSVDDAFFEALLDAAREVPESVYQRLLLRLEDVGTLPQNERDAEGVVRGALQEYARNADQGIGPGP